MFEQQGGYVRVHGKAACLLGVVQRDINACTFGTCPVGGDCVVLLEGMQEVFSMLALGVLDAEVINDEDKHDWPPFMMPKAGGCSTLVVSVRF